MYVVCLTELISSLSMNFLPAMSAIHIVSFHLRAAFRFDIILLKNQQSVSSILQGHIKDIMGYIF